MTRRLIIAIAVVLGVFLAVYAIAQTGTQPSRELTQQDTQVNWNTIILAIIGLASTGLTGVLAIYMSKMNTKAASTLDNSHETKAAAQATAASMEKVHEAVNSERTAMLNEIKRLRDDMTIQASTIATLIERAKGVATAANVERTRPEERP